MSGPSREFLDYIVANIDEDTPRLAYADWLAENGQDARAEFVRVQVERARLPAWDAAQIRLRLREQDLLDRHGEEWLAELPTITGARWEGFRRGVVAEVSFSSFESMRKNVHACRAVAPVEAVTVHWPRRREVRQADKPIAELRELTLTGNPEYEAFDWVAESPQLATLRVLTAGGVFSDLEALLASPHLANLRSLRLPANGLQDRGFVAVAEAATLTALEELDLSAAGRYERYDPDAVLRLMSWPGLATVRTLNFAGNNLTRDGLRDLLRSPHAAGLKNLSIRSGRLDGQAMAEFESAVSGLQLDSLDVGENVLKAVGAEYIALASCLRGLKALRIDRCEIPLDGARLFAKKAKYLDGLRVLDVGHNHFGPTGLTALLQRKPAALHTLRVRDNDLHDEGAKVLAESPASETLAELDLSRNDLGNEAAKALGGSPHLDGLLVLHLGDNPLNRTAVTALKASPLGRRLAVLGMEHVPDPPPDEFEGEDA